MLASHKAYKKCLLGTYSFYMVPCLARSRLTGLASLAPALRSRARGVALSSLAQKSGCQIKDLFAPYAALTPQRR